MAGVNLTRDGVSLNLSSRQEAIVSETLTILRLMTKKVSLQTPATQHHATDRIQTSELAASNASSGCIDGEMERPFQTRLRTLRVATYRERVGTVAVATQAIDTSGISMNAKSADW